MRRWWPALYQTELVGELLVATRGPGETFSRSDRRLLEDLARQAGVAAYAVCAERDLRRLTRDLHHARERLVAASEDEHRRLRRDLHEVSGPR